MKRNPAAFTLILTLIFVFSLAACATKRKKEEVPNSHKSMEQLNTEVQGCYKTTGQGFQSQVFAMKALTFKQKDRDRQKLKVVVTQMEHLSHIGQLCNLKKRWLRLKYEQAVFDQKLGGEAQVSWTRKFNTIDGLIESVNSAIDSAMAARRDAQLRCGINECS